MARTTHRLAAVWCAAAVWLSAGAAAANPPFTAIRPGGKHNLTKSARDVPNPAAVLRLRERERVLKLLRSHRLTAQRRKALEHELRALALTGSDKVLVILVEFVGPDTFTYTPGVSTWDPIGTADDTEWSGAVGNCSVINSRHTLSAPTDFTYDGPRHNQIPRPLSAADASGDTIWTEDFSPAWYNAFMFGDGIVLNYVRQDQSPVFEDFTGKSVHDYYEDMSGGNYTVTGDVIGWLQLPHSAMWYGADPCPGARSTAENVDNNAGISGAGSSKSLVRDALDAVNAAYPNFDWTQYDRDDDGVIDRLWIVHAGYGEEGDDTLMNRVYYGTDSNFHYGFGETNLWSHSSSLSPAYQVDAGAGISAGPYIMMPEDGGIGVFAHESGHNLGADDLYAYTGGETSAGFWTLMADDWTGYPIGFQPPALDPLHLDQWGWLEPLEIADEGQVYSVTLGQASSFPGGSGVYRGAKIVLPPPLLPAAPLGDRYWWGGNGPLQTSLMRTKNTIAIPAGGATLTLRAAWNTENLFDYFWVMASVNDGASWVTLTNGSTKCIHDPEWIGGSFGFPDDLCGAGMGGFSGTSSGWPLLTTQSFSLNSFANQNVMLLFFYMTDANIQGFGPFIDDISVTAGQASLFSDGGESGDSLWTYGNDRWIYTQGRAENNDHFYLQWRNVSSNGGYDSSLADPRWRYGPANSGLLVWYHSALYSENEIWYHMDEPPSYGPKGKMLVVDAHPEPYRFQGSQYENEAGNLASRGQMRDAPFSLSDSVPFSYGGNSYPGRAAVSQFSDAFGFYPGIEWAKAGPAYSAATKLWMTKAWDASTVLPAWELYTVKSSRDDNGDYFQDPPPSLARALREWIGPLPGGFIDYGWRYDTGFVLNLGGGEGNPGETPGNQYGWHVKILSQTDSTARLRIWNSTESTAVPMAISVVKSGSGSGTVTSAGGSVIDCGATCSAYRPEGTEISLSAAAAGTSHFNGWSGGGCSGTADCRVTLTEDVTVTANFASGACYSLKTAVSPEGAGTIAALTEPNCEGDKYLAGTVVTLAAAPAGAYAFSGWDGAVGPADAGTVAMESDKTVTAQMAACFDIAVAAEPARGGAIELSPPPNCAGGRYAAGTQLQLTARAEPPYRFARWEQAASGSQVSTTITIVSNGTVRALFSRHCVTLAASVDPPGAGIINREPRPNCGENRYVEGSRVSLSARPRRRHAFRRWRGHARGTRNPLSITLSEDREAVAEFRRSRRRAW